MKNLGNYIKELRERERLPQRKLAYQLNLDVSVLSKIENENKLPKKRVSEIINIVSSIFNVSQEDLKRMYLSDEICLLLRTEDDYKEILKISGKKVNYMRSGKGLIEK